MFGACGSATERPIAARKEQQIPVVPAPPTTSPGTIDPVPTLKPALAPGTPIVPLAALPALAAARSCAVRSRLSLDPRAKLGAVAADGDRALIVLVLPSANGGVLSLSRSDGGSLEPVLQVPLATALALAPVIDRGSHDSLSLALVDTQGTLSLLEIGAGKASPVRVLSRNVDRRFAPSMVSAAGTRLVAYTQTVDALMHTFVARVSATAVELHDVTPVSHGAAAGTFALGAKEPVLVMLDARAGVSPLLEVGFDAAAKPRAAIVRTPVSQPYAPPLLAAIEIPGADLQVAYTAIGRAAATAVGIVPLRRADAPRALLPSLGYGALAFAAAVGARAAVFATEAPVSAASDAPRSIMVKVIDERGEGEALTIAGERGSCARPLLAASARARVFFLLHAEGAALVLSVLDCDA